MASAEEEGEVESAGLGGFLSGRLVAALAPIALLVVVVRATGLHSTLDVDGLREVVEAAGVWRIPIFVGVYGLGIVVAVPGAIFVAAGVLAFGTGWGFVWCYVGALFGNLVTFGLARATGARPLARITWPVTDRLFRRIRAQPTRAVILIRTIFPTTAPINYALGLTDVPFGSYLTGCLIGVLPQLSATVGLFGFVFD